MIKKVIMKPKQRVRKILNKTYGISVKRKGSKNETHRSQESWPPEANPMLQNGEGVSQRRMQICR